MTEQIKKALAKMSDQEVKTLVGADDIIRDSEAHYFNKEEDGVIEISRWWVIFLFFVELKDRIKNRVWDKLISLTEKVDERLATI